MQFSMKTKLMNDTRTEHSVTTYTITYSAQSAI